MCIFNNDNPTIVVTWDPEKYGYWGYFATVDVQLGMLIRIKGAGFNYRDTVVLNICGKWDLGSVVVNECGAFVLNTQIPNDQGLYSLPVWSVKAWVNNKLKAVWPVDILRPQTKIQLPKV